MGELLHFSGGVVSQPEEFGQGRLAASQTLDSIIGLTNALGACLEGLISSLGRLEEVSLGLDDMVGRLSPGEARQQIEHQQALIKEQLVIAHKLLAGI